MTTHNASVTARTVVESTLVPHTAFNLAMERIQQALEYGQHSPEPTGIALVGESRTGKTRVLEEANQLEKGTRTREGKVVPILMLRTPARPTVKALASQALRTMGDPRWEKGSETSMTARLHGLFGECETLMLMVDEFQHFFDKGRKRVFFEVSDWLKFVMDETRVTVVVSGLESCLPVLLQNEQLNGRFLGPIHLCRFHWLKDGDRAEFLGILAAFHEAMSTHFDIPELHGTEMAFRIWCASGGLIGYVAKLLRQTVWDVCEAGKCSITLEDLKRAHARTTWTEFNRKVATAPFDRTFSVDPNQETIDRALSIGVREEPDEHDGNSGGRVTRHNPSRRQSNPTVAQILSRSGP